MAHPFIIWTFQRSGGTSLSVALGEAIDPAPLKQEPFNPERDFGQVTLSLRKEKFPKGVQALGAILGEGISFKHCFELRSKRFNEMLLFALSANRNYRNVVLMRSHEIDRVCSLYLAKQTSVWGKWKVKKGGYDDVLAGRKKLEPFPVEAMVTHSLRCKNYHTWLLQKFEEMDIDHFDVDFDEMYTGEREARIAKTSCVFDYIDAKFDQNNNAILARILSEKQGSNRLYSYVPNYDEARAVLRSRLEPAAPA